MQNAPMDKDALTTHLFPLINSLVRLPESVQRDILNGWRITVDVYTRPRGQQAASVERPSTRRAAVTPLRLVPRTALRQRQERGRP